MRVITINLAVIQFDTTSDKDIGELTQGVIDEINTVLQEQPERCLNAQIIDYSFSTEINEEE